MAVFLGSCDVSLDVPPAPDLQPVLQAYANPSAVVTSEIMSAVGDEIAKAAEEIQDSEIFAEILDVIIEVQMEIENATVNTCKGGSMNGSECTADADCPGGTCGTDLVLGGVCGGGTNDGGDCASDTDCPGGTCGGGVILPTPTGAIRINYICPGWDEAQFDDGYDAEPDSANGTIDLYMTLDSGGIGRVVWGTADKCLYLLPDLGGSCGGAGCAQASYDGGVALDLGDPDWLNQDIAELLVTFVLEGTIGFEGGDSRINQSFRLILADESGLELLVDLADPALSETFNYIFQGPAQAIRDTTGLFGCSLEERRCFDESGTLFSW